jgi:hypothetical protein
VPVSRRTRSAETLKRGTEKYDGDHEVTLFAAVALLACVAMLIGVASILSVFSDRYGIAFVFIHKASNRSKTRSADFCSR